MAEAMAQCGGRLRIASDNEKGCRKLARQLNACFGEGTAMALKLDITDIEQCRAVVEEPVNQMGKLDVLFNNARRLMRGRGLPPKGNSLPIWKTDPVIYAETVNVNVVGTFNMTRAAVEYFRTRKFGKIINISTSSRNFSHANNSPYGVTKAALEAQTLIWSAECEKESIMINSLLPGGSVDSDTKRPDRHKKKLQPVDVMDPVAVWLSSDKSDGVTGCRFNAKLWNPLLPTDLAAIKAREEPVFSSQPIGRFKNY